MIGIAIIVAEHKLCFTLQNKFPCSGLHSRTVSSRIRFDKGLQSTCRFLCICYEKLDNQMPACTHILTHNLLFSGDVNAWRPATLLERVECRLYLPADQKLNVS